MGVSARVTNVDESSAFLGAMDTKVGRHAVSFSRGTCKMFEPFAAESNETLDPLSFCESNETCLFSHVCVYTLAR